MRIIGPGASVKQAYSVCADCSWALVLGASFFICHGRSKGGGEPVTDVMPLAVTSVWGIQCPRLFYGRGQSPNRGEVLADGSYHHRGRREKTRRSTLHLPSG